MSQVSAKPQRNIGWRIVRGLVEVLRWLAFITWVLAPLGVFIWQLIVSIIGVVTGSISVLDVVPSLFGTMFSYSILAGIVGFVLLALIALLEGLLPPAYRLPSFRERLPDFPPQTAQANEERILAPPLHCPDPQCGALLDVQAGMRLYLDPQTGEQVSPNSGYGGNIRLPGCLLGMLLVWGTALLVGAGHIDKTPIGKILMSLGILAGVAVYIVSLLVVDRKQKAALARAERVLSCPCSRCGRWWMVKLDVPLQTIAQEPSAGGQ